MKVSVIMPSYNSFDFIEESVRSVLSQKYQNLELIIVDDNSDKATVDLIKKLAAEDDRVITCFFNENKGAALARNKALELATGQYIAFLDSDDLWYPEKLETQISYMQENHVYFSCTFYKKIDEQGRDLNVVIGSESECKLTYQDMLKSNRIGCLTAVYDTHQLGKVPMPELRKRQDYALWLRLLKKVDAVCFIPEVLAKYRVRAGSISSNKFEMLKFNWAVYRKCEKMGVLASFYYLCWNVLRKLGLSK